MKPPSNDIEPQNTDKLFAEFVQKMQLIAPEEQDYYESPIDHGRIFFISAYGCTIRMTPTSRKLKEEHPNFLVPLFNRQAGSYTIEINPGIECPLPEEDLENVIKTMKQKGVRMYDSHAYNFGYVPGTKYPVVLDLDKNHVRVRLTSNDNIINFIEKSIEILSKSVPTIKQALKNLFESRKDKTDKINSQYNKIDEINPQHERYEPLIRILKQAWPEDQKEPDSIGIKKFWEACAQMKQQGLLVSPWEQEENNYRTTHSAASHYNKKLSHNI